MIRYIHIYLDHLPDVRTVRIFGVTFRIIVHHKYTPEPHGHGY